MLGVVIKEQRLTTTRVAALIGLGLVAGLFSGLFGVGGGMIIVPGLVVVLRVEHKLAVGTSLMAIVPACAVGIVSYALQGPVDWIAGLVVAIGSVVGAQFGAKLLTILPRRAAQWVFVVFVVAMIVELLIVVPNRGGTMTWDVLNTICLIALGLVAGVLSGLLGIGGGAVVVPIMMLGFGVSDLIAKSASLIMMLPAVLSGLIGNLRAHRVLVKAGLIIGLSAVVTGPVGSWFAHVLPPNVANWCFAAYLAFVCVMMTREALHRDPKPSAPDSPDGSGAPDLAEDAEA